MMISKKRSRSLYRYLINKIILLEYIICIALQIPRCINALIARLLIFYCCLIFENSIKYTYILFINFKIQWKIMLLHS